MEDSQHGSLQMLKKIENYVFNLTQKVGEGSFSQVYRGTNINNNATVAVKKIRIGDVKSKIARRLLECEITILRRLDHAHIIKCLDIHFSINNCYIITEFCDGGNLESLLKREKNLSELEIRKIIWSIFQALQYLNNLGIVHRDLKVSNIFIRDGLYTIGDFGFAIQANSLFKDVTIGSPIYMSPEGLISNLYGPKTDVWAFGILIYQLLHRTTPLQNCKSQEELRKKVIQPPVFKKDIAPQLKQLMTGCLRVNEKERMSIAQLGQLSYICRLKREAEKELAIDKDQTVTDNSSTQKSISQKSYHSIPQISNDAAIAVINYCRLTHKIAKLSPSSVFAKCLIWLTRNLARAQITTFQKGQKQTNIHELIKEYNQNYMNEYGYDFSEQFRLQDMVLQCERRAQKDNRLALQYKILSKETEILMKCFEQGSIQYFAKKSRSKQYLNTIPSRE